MDNKEKKEKKEKKEMIKYRMKQLQDNIKAYRSMVQDYKRELDFMNGHYDKTWEEEYRGSPNLKTEDGCGKLWDDPSRAGSFVTKCHSNNLCPDCSANLKLTHQESQDE